MPSETLGRRIAGEGRLSIGGEVEYVDPSEEGPGAGEEKGGAWEEGREEGKKAPDDDAPGARSLTPEDHVRGTREKLAIARSAMTRPMARDAVAAGDGAFRTWIWQGASTM